MLFSNEREVRIWEDVIELNLREFGTYVKVESIDLVGIYIGIWAK
jgi:hypothetical protein